MLFYISLADARSGKWVGAVIVNRPTHCGAGRSAVEVYALNVVESGGEFDGELEAAIRPLPVGACVPAGYIGRLLNHADLAAMGEIRHMKSDGEGHLRDVEAPAAVVH